METAIILGRNLRLFREKMGLTQESFSQYLGVTREEISYFENGKRNIPTQVITKASRLFGIDEYDLFEEDENLLESNLAFAFRAENLSIEDYTNIATFKTIVQNYLKMSKALDDE